MCSVEQLDTKPFLQGANTPAEGRLGHVPLFGSSGKIARLC
jgi:hypothetical protein